MDRQRDSYIPIKTLFVGGLTQVCAPHI